MIKREKHKPSRGKTRTSHTKNGQYQLVILPSTFSPSGRRFLIKHLGQLLQASLPGQTGISLLHGLYESLRRLVGGQQFFHLLQVAYLELHGIPTGRAGKSSAPEAKESSASAISASMAAGEETCKWLTCALAGVQWV